MVRLIVIVALGTIPKELIDKLENYEISGQVETFLNTALIISARILRRVMET